MKLAPLMRSVALVTSVALLPVATAGLAQVDSGGGYPTCRQWWSDGNSGLRARLLGYFMRGDWAWGVEDGVIQKGIFQFSLSLDI